MERIVVIDWRGVANLAWHSLASGNLPRTRPTELKEGIHRISKLVYSLWKIHAWDKCVIAMDTPRYWRVDYLEQWWKDNTQLHIGMRDGEWVEGVWMQNGWRIIEDGELKKLTKKVADSIEWDLSEKEMDIPFPKYKGNRAKQPWNYTTPKDEWNVKIDRLAELIAPLIGARVIKAPRCEADDIAAVVGKYAQTHEVVLISADSDWEQIMTFGDNIKIHNPSKNLWVKSTDHEAVKASLHRKIITGDSGDGVPSCVPGGHIKGVSYGNGLGDKAYDRIQEADEWDLVDADTVQRNHTLIDLSVSWQREEVVQPILHALSTTTIGEVECTWDDIQLTKRDRETYATKADAERIFAEWGEYLGNDRLNSVLGA